MDYSSIFYDHVIKTGKTIHLTSAGFSMWPLITEGMKAEISSLESGLPQKGTLLLVKRRNGLMVHRLWKILNEDGTPIVLTKGDTNTWFDKPVSMDMVMGQVVSLKSSSKEYRYPNQGWLYLFGRVLCSSKTFAYFWARVCRLILKVKWKLF